MFWTLAFSKTTSLRPKTPELRNPILCAIPADYHGADSRHRHFHCEAPPDSFESPGGIWLLNMFVCVTLITIISFGSLPALKLIERVSLTLIDLDTKHIGTNCPGILPRLFRASEIVMTFDL